MDDIHAHQAADLFTACTTIASAVAMGISNIRNDTDFGLEDVWLVNWASSAISHAIASSKEFYYPSGQISSARHHAAIRVNDLKENEATFCTGNSFTIRIAPVLKNLAWQSYYENDYGHSRKILDRLFEAGIQDEEDYLLMAKLYRVTAEDEKDLQLALNAVTRAEESDDFNFVEVIFEKGMILMQLERYPEAKEAFVEFLAAVAEVGGDPDEIEESRKMLMRCYLLLDEE
jgi:tetratricopeptide (TPR) repeat protein